MPAETMSNSPVSFDFSRQLMRSPGLTWYEGMFTFFAIHLDVAVSDDLPGLGP
jgi:hypothetical protein